MGKHKSELVKWSSAFTSGVKLIDEQHKGLLTLVNDLFNHVIGDEEEEHTYFEKVIESAVDYVKVHFSTEEQMMIQTEFPGYEEHKKAHDAFVLVVVDKTREFEAGNALTLLDFTRFLKEWILTHIAIMDKQYFVYFKQVKYRS